MSEPKFILRGLGGSHAHGLATATSDEDLIGVFSWPTVDFWTLSEPQASIVKHDPQDEAYHELRKFCSLAAKANPTVLEILWLDSYTEKERGWGDDLIAIRGAFLSKHYVMNAYVGYAESQFRKMVKAGDENARSRSPKNAVHMLRLMEQGRNLYEWGVLNVRVENPAQYREWATWSTERLSEEFTKQWSAFIDSDCRLRDEPDFDTINTYLRSYRRQH